MNKNNDIDFVIPWVDGSDPEWQKEKALYSQDTGEIASSQNNDRARYEDWGLLRYWFRGVENFAPWVRKIHFVTWGHVPSWLNLNHPKLNIVKHEDYIPKEYLPTFSSHPIELNFHRIPDLAEQFVYFNDDMFLLKPVRKEDFFKKGLPCAFACLMPLRTEKGDWFYYPFNNVAVINEHFSKYKSVLQKPSKWFNPKYGANNFISLLMLPFPAFYGFYEQHLPNSFLKSTYEIVWKEEFEILDRASKHKFRHHSDVNQWLIENWQFASGNFIPRSPKFGKVFRLTNSDKETVKNACMYISKQAGKVTCINDCFTASEEGKSAQIAIKKAFDSLPYSKSEFEI